jgi:transcriptional regulator with XRE-family HTH domain
MNKRKEKLNVRSLTNIQGDNLSIKKGMHLATEDCAISGDADNQGQFGAELYRLRTIAGLKQVDVARLTGLTRGYYSQLENSKRFPPPLPTLKRVAAALRLSNNQLNTLRHLADAERCLMVALPQELPAELANVFRQLAARAYRLSSRQLRQISNVIEEESAM